MRMAALHPDTDIQLAREVAAPPPPAPKAEIAPQLDLHQRALAPEIMAGKVSAEQTPSTIFVRVGSVVLFPSGGASANRAFAPIAKKIAAALNKQPGAITVTGYTDADPIHTLQFPSNFELSEARAKSAAGIAEGGPCATRSGSSSTARAPPIPSPPTTSRPTRRRTGASNSRSRGGLTGQGTLGDDRSG